MESLSRPLQRNHANFSRKLSSKNAYDDVFAGPPKFGAPTFSSRVEDYAEIFGTSQGSRSSSIPVLDLSDVDETNVSTDFRNSTPDYSSIFVGFRDEDIGMSYDELFAGTKGANSSSAKTRTPSATKSPHQHSDHSNSLEQNQSFDAVKQFNMSYHKTSQKVKDETKVTTHVAELRAEPGFTCFIDETAPLNKTEGGKQKQPAINEVRQKMDFSATSPLTKKQSKGGGFVRSRGGSSWDGTYSNDKLFKNAHEKIHLKSHPSNSEKINGSFKKSTTAASNKEVPRADARDRSLDSSDDELDMNSAAAASVAALRKAIEQAQESIRIAKELMEKKEGPNVIVKKGSKSSSKVKDRGGNGIAPQRNRTDEETKKEISENTHVLDAAEKCEGATGSFELVNNGKHRRAISAFEQVDRNEFREMQEGTTQKAEVVFEPNEVKEEKEREERGFEILQDREENLDKFESSFVVHELEETEIPEAQEVEETEDKENSSEVKAEELMETIEDEEFFESQDWDEKDQEERVNGSLELVGENEHNLEVVPEQEIIEERSKDAEIEENDEQVLVKRLEEAFQWVENEIRVREVIDGYSNEPKQKDESAGEITETGAHEEKETAENIENENEKDIKSEGNEGMQVDEKRPNDACDWKESEENISAGKWGAKEKSDENVERESDESEENEEIKVDEKRPTGGNDGEESEKNMNGKKESDGTEEDKEINVPEEEDALHFNRVSDASNSSTSATVEEECQHEIKNDIVKASPRVSTDAENSENLGSTDSDIGENQVEQNNEDSELASDLEYGSDIMVNDLRECDQIVKEEEETEKIKSRNDVEKNEESSNKRMATEEKEKEEKESASNEEIRVIAEAKKREREREKKDRIVVERAIREARERAFAEARERAERAAVEKVNAAIRQRVMAEARDKFEKASSSSSSSYQKVSQDAKLKAERAAVERATSEARKRALEKALSQKNSSEARVQPVTEKFPGASGDFSSSSDSQKSDGTNSESYLRSKAKLEKQQRIMQRAAKALAEKNMRDILAQKEQAERNRLSESLDADIKRWSNGKEGNLRAQLSTLQYILGPGSGWQPVSLNDIITTSAVKKAYRKATLYVHPDKLQQRGATIQQKYICEKVFDLLKAAWNKFNAEER